MAAKDANDTVLEVTTPIIRGKQPYADFWGITQMRTVRVSYIWTIKDFNILMSKKVDAIFTEEFAAEHAPHVVWQMILRIGPNEQEDLQLELHHVQKKSIPYKLLLKANISILNAESERNHAAATFEGFSKEKDKWEKLDFVSKALLMENPDDLLPRNSLTLFCEISQSGYFNIQKDKNVPIYEDRMSDDISKLFENSLWADAYINVQETVFKVRKAVLAARCPVFWAMFKPDMRMKEEIESVVEIKNIKPKVFREVLRYMYTGEIESADETVIEILIAADEYILEGLKIICENTLYEIIKARNAMNILVVADQLEMSALKQQVLKFIKNNLADVMKSKSWDEVLVSHVDLATEIMQLHISE
ncbi:speckle-type POZ protein B-like [Belonocnema kinseyi]|uniref:speckle-type POZ protein B-like n=1 Tax=Belonocnema kinseyi TaxID=2817044 RepID=UPI00143D0417|nr:speckle-type POZ protein B-like [Belonocnema kinseyi]